MNYFNLRYECLDARDDFSSQLRQGGLVPDGTCPKFMTLDMMEDLDQDSLNNGDQLAGSGPLLRMAGTSPLFC
jgi:hypothetical protein